MCDAVPDSDPLLPGPLNSTTVRSVAGRRCRFDDVRPEHERRRAGDDVVDLADLIVFGDRVRRRLVQLAAIHHADADVSLAELDVAHLLIDAASRRWLSSYTPRVQRRGM